MGGYTFMAKFIQKEKQLDKLEEEPDEEYSEEEVSKVPQPPKAISTKDPVDQYTVGEVATQTAPVIFDKKTEKPYTELMALCELLNRIARIENILEG
jgi:hypothetical protein